MKKVVIAADSFKESLSSLKVAEAIERGLRAIYPDTQYITLPIADGGEGTVEALILATGGKLTTQTVIGPLGEPVNAVWGLLGNGDTAVIEIAAACGLHLVPAQRRDPTLTTSFGVGELILAALDSGVKTIILGIGGSATNDGGAGMLQALGAQLLDQYGAPLAQGGAALAGLKHIDLAMLDSRLAAIKIVVACDVNNPLCGENGASVVFGPQKGASEAQVQLLDRALWHYGQLIEQLNGVAVVATAGSGAAGGMGAALLGLLDAQLRPGIEIVLETVKFDQLVQGADLVITGEGRLDSQTIHGKVPIGVAKVAKRYNIPVIAIVGSLAHDYHVVYQHGIDSVFSILNHIVTQEEAFSEAESNLEITAYNIATLWQAAQKRNVN